MITGAAIGFILFTLLMIAVIYYASGRDQFCPRKVIILSVMLTGTGGAIGHLITVFTGS